MENFCLFSWIFELNAVGACLAWASFQSDRRTEKIYTAATFKGKIRILLLQGVVLAIAAVIAKTPYYCLDAIVILRWRHTRKKWTENNLEKKPWWLALYMRNWNHGKLLRACEPINTERFYLPALHGNLWYPFYMTCKKQIICFLSYIGYTG